MTTEDQSWCETESVAPEPSQCTRETVSTSTTTTDEETQIIITTARESLHSLPRYPKFVVQHPFVLFGLIFLFVVLCACVSCIPQLGAPKLPNFAEPIKGFEARGTVISNRWLSQLNLVENELNQGVSRIPWQCRSNLTVDGITTQPAAAARALCNEYMTFSQGKLAMKLVFTTVHKHQNLMTAGNLKSICRLEKDIVRSFKNFDEHCHKDKKTKKCCPSWSIGELVAWLTGKPSCLAINSDDVTKVTALLTECSGSYKKGALRADCWDFKHNRKAVGKCLNAAPKCTRFNAVYNILHYLTDKDFLSGGSTVLRYSQVLVPTNDDQDFQVDIYNSRLDKDFVQGNVVLAGYELSELKFAMFNQLLLRDLYLAAVAMFFVVTILWLYTRSFLITSMVGFIVVSSLIIAYFIYTIVLGMKFFPFLNILTLVFLVGIGADDAFVYMDVWNQSVLEHKERRSSPTTDNNERMHELISVTADTMKHASMSMFVTSFTTASAFFASLTSEITSIRLFGLYSGIAILCMLLLMVTWFPAAVIIDETVLARYCSCSLLCAKLRPSSLRTNADRHGLVAQLIICHRRVFNELLPRLIVKLRFFWVILFLGLAVGGVLVATVKPGLKLPSSQDFQMFRESHELEKYSLELKQNFHFETSDSNRFPIRLIWGIRPLDNGDQFDPYNTGTLTWDQDFDVATPQGQMWLVKLVDRIKKQPFFAKEQELSDNCFIEEFFKSMQVNCTEHNRPCCKESSFPYPEKVFNQCLLRMQCQKIKQLEDSQHSITDGAPLFDSNGTLRVISLTFESSTPFTWSYEPAESFWKETDGWATREFQNAPASANGWFISELRFYDLQRSLSKGTFFSMGISLAMAFVVMLLTTGNIFISIFAIFTIMGALGVTIGALVLIGWKLNILESVTMSVAVGLSVDFALHYGVAYVLADDKTDRQGRVWFSVSRMGSAITMAAFTTFLTGAVVMPSSVLSYVQLGQFLMLIMSISWLYATFFFQAICSILGPENDSGQLTVAKIRAMFTALRQCCSKNKSDHYQELRKKDGTVVKRQAIVVYRK